MQSPRVIIGKLDPINFHDPGRDGSDPADSLGLGPGPPQLASDSKTVLLKDGCLGAEAPAMPDQKDVTVFLKRACDSRCNSTDTLSSPVRERRTYQCSKPMDKSKDRKEAYLLK